MAKEVNVYKWICPHCGYENSDLSQDITNNPESLRCVSCCEYVEVYSGDL